MRGGVETRRGLYVPGRGKRETQLQFVKMRPQTSARMSTGGRDMPKPKASDLPIAKPRIPATHPAYSEMIKQAVAENKDKSGSSKAALLKYIVQHFKIGENIPKINAQLRLALKRGVASGAIKQVKGHGASGSFKLGEKKVATAKPKATGAKKPVAKKPSAEKKAKSPKKVAKKPAAKTIKKHPSPKKAKKAKKSAAAAKKSAPKAVRMAPPVPLSVS